MRRYVGVVLGALLAGCLVLTGCEESPLPEGTSGGGGGAAAPSTPAR